MENFKAYDYKKKKGYVRILTSWKSSLQTCSLTRFFEKSNNISPLSGVDRSKLEIKIQ